MSIFLTSGKSVDSTSSAYVKNPLSFFHLSEMSSRHIGRQKRDDSLLWISKICIRDISQDGKETKISFRYQSNMFETNFEMIFFRSPFHLLFSKIEMDLVYWECTYVKHFFNVCFNVRLKNYTLTRLKSLLSFSNYSE